jgi:hypothetical protein
MMRGKNFYVQDLNVDLAGNITDSLGTFGYHPLNGNFNANDQFLELVSHEKKQLELYKKDPRKYVAPPQYMELRRGTASDLNPRVITRVKIYEDGALDEPNARKTKEILEERGIIKD